MEKDPFKEYLKESEPDKAYKGYAWSTAIGLQAVDGLKISEMPLSVRIIQICKKGFMKQQNILKCFLKICF